MGRRDAQDMVLRDRNHPSIIMWSIGNEIDYPTDPFVHPLNRVDSSIPVDPKAKPGPSANLMPSIERQLIAAVKRFDATRPVTMALADINVSNMTGVANMLDVVGYNYFEQYYERDHKAYPHIGLKKRLHARRGVVGAGAALRGIEFVAARCNIQVRHLGVGLGRMQHQFEEGIARRRGQRGLHFFGARHQRIEIRCHALGFPVIGEAETGLRRPAYFRHVETSSAISAAGCPPGPAPNSRSAHRRVNSPSFSLGQRCGSRAKLRKSRWEIPSASNRPR